MSEQTNRVVTENAEEEQWRLLTRLAYPRNIRAYRDGHAEVPLQAEGEEYVSGCLRQAQAYFESAAVAPIDISPLLLYYGAVSLFGAATALGTGVVPAIQSHGMQLDQVDAAQQIGQVSVKTSSSLSGGLGAFAKYFGDDCRLGGVDTWSLQELMASVPDLKLDAQLCYGADASFVLPVETVRSGERSAERIALEDFGGRPVDEVVGRIAGFTKAYLPPQFSNQNEWVVLHRRIGSQPIGIRSLSGQRYLQLSHLKGGQQVSPRIETLMFMGLFVLGSVSRYHPSLWNPFVRSDQTGELLIVERFLSVCRRMLPNLVLDAIHDERFIFVRPSAGGEGND